MDYGLKYIKSKIIKLKLLDEKIDEIFIALVRQRFLTYVSKALFTKEKKMITLIRFHQSAKLP